MRRKEFVLGGVVFVVATLGFALGYLLNRESSHAPIILEQCSR